MLNSLAQILPQSAKKYGSKTALIFESREFSFETLDKVSNQVASALTEIGILPGDRVTLYGSNSVEWIVSYHGILKAGAVVNPINSMLIPSEVEYVIRDCASKAVIASQEQGTALANSKVIDSLEGLIIYGEDIPQNALSFYDLINKEKETFSIPSIDSRSTASICYTSGTTGQPKGAMLSHDAVLTNVMMTSLMYSRSENDTVVSSLPCPHVYGNVVTNGSLQSGSTLVLHARFDPGETLASIAEHKATMFEGVPTMYLYMLECPEISQYDISTLRMCSVGGQSMPKSKMEALEEKLCCPLIELWGMTELAGVGTTTAYTGPRKHGSIGVPLPYVQVKVVEDNSSEKVLKPNEVGELMIKGPVVMQGYYGNDNATSECIDEQGWLHTGDVGYVDDEGYIFLVDRKKDMILTAGFNIYPAELESVLASHPDVAMAAVGPVPDSDKGELAKAYIIPKKGTDPSDEDLVSFCRNHLAAYKVPRLIQFVDDFPKTSSGKVMRRELIKLHNLSRP